MKYFDRYGNHTDECLKIVRNYANSINSIVVASTTGATGLRFAEMFGKTHNVVVVTHCYGFQKENKIEISEDIKKKIESLGAKILTCTILTSSLNKSFIVKYGGFDFYSIVADTLRRFGEGVKVCVEIVLESADAGLVKENEDVIAVAGTGRHADTVCLIRASTSRRFHNLKIKKILAKPIEF